MTRWSPWGQTKKYQVKFKSMRLDGFEMSEAASAENEEIQKEESNNNKVMTVEVKWKGPTKKKSGLVVPFPTIKFQQLRNVSRDAGVPRNGDSLVWDEPEFEHTCNFSILSPSSKDGKISYGSWDVSFHLLLGEESNKKKMRDIGKGAVDLGELLMSCDMEEAEIRHSVPIAYQFDGQPPRQATLLIAVSFTKMKVSHTRSNSCDSAELIPSSSDELSKPHDSFMMRAKSFGLSQSKKKRTMKSSQAAATHDSSNSEESDSAASCSVIQLEVPEDKNSGFWIWKRRGNRASFKRAKTTDSQPLKGDETEGVSTSEDGGWEVKELTSRDGRAKLKGKVFFGTYDQRSEKAAGESACTAIVAVFAHWLQANPSSMPTRVVFDQLIAEGSSEWRRLCKDDSRRAEFPNSHFDLDTVLEADLRPITVLRERSHVGFFSPEEFEYLKEAKSFDDIWKEMNESPLPGVYIVSWNDHFFVLKVGPEACYIVDSLGERLYEGCDRAYILEFDGFSVMCGTGGEEEEVICKGKECCSEYIKRFLAAIAVRELKEEEDKGTVCIFKLHKRLQIEFHYSSSPDPSASTSRTESPMIHK